MNVFHVPRMLFADVFNRIKATGNKRWPAMGELGAMHRINALAGLMAARHGWLGATFSVQDILTVIYHLLLDNPLLPLTERGAVVLSKGHGVLAQYSVLESLGVLPEGAVLSYKAADGLPAHCDSAVPGIDSDSGSLGLGLSKGLGLARAQIQGGMAAPVYVILGDGELQEGQVFEALLTLKQWDLRTCIPIIDRNGMQSDSQTAAIKDARDWPAVLRGIGLRVVRVNGHDPGALYRVLRKAPGADKPTVVLADTIKGFGSAVTGMPKTTARRQGIWHGRIPSREEYETILAELVNRINNPGINTLFDAWKREDAAEEAREQASLAGGSIGTAPSWRHRNTTPSLAGGSEGGQPATIPTGQAFGRALVAEADAGRSFWALSADLEKSCALSEFAAKHPRQLLEVGISEQDMISIAHGLGLGGTIAVVNTYAAFFKRAVDQIAALAAERVPVILAGHYAGFDYFTDGKSHQSGNDVAMIRAIGGIDIYEPLTAGETGQILSYLLNRFEADLRARHASRPAYVRLHRTPMAAELPLPGPFHPCRPHRFPGSEKARFADFRLFTSSPHLTSLALQALAELSKNKLAGEVVAVSSFQDREGILRRLVRSCGRAISLESHQTRGGLGDHLFDLAEVPVLKIGMSGSASSTRTLGEMAVRQGLTVDQVVRRIRAELAGRPRLPDL